MSEERCDRCGQYSDDHPLAVEVYRLESVNTFGTAVRQVRTLRSVTGCPAFVPKPVPPEREGP